jgi:hypothetical protein
MTAPGIHIMSAEAYHGDPCDRPSLSASIAHILLDKSPLHAWYAHPRLNPDFVRKEEKKFDVGTAAHALLFEDTQPAIIDAPDWRTKKAQEERDEARAAGLTPLLAKQAVEVTAMVDAVRGQLDELDIDPPLFREGTPEKTLVWEDTGGVICRARVDYLHDDYTAIDDMKTAGRSANPFQWTRNTLWSIGADVQVGFNRRAVKKLTGQDAWFRYVVVETAPPYALSIVDLSPAALALADAKVEKAIAIWRRCLDTDVWPSYPQQVVSAEPLPWHEAAWLEQQAIEEELAA